MEQHIPWYQILQYERKLRGWSQKQLASSLGSDPKTIGRWELGRAFPSPYFQEQLVKVFNKDAEQLGLVPALQAMPTTGTGKSTMTPSPLPASRIDWGDAVYNKPSYGRTYEIATLTSWITHDRCQLLAILGFGGIGKTTLSIMLTKQMQSEFDYIFWRSLQNAPPLQQILEEFFLFISQHHIFPLLEDDEDPLPLLMIQLRQHRCLLILDNFESVLQEEKDTGHYRAGYEAYGKLLQQIGEVEHQSCLVITSREKPREISHQEGYNSPVRSLSLPGMTTAETQKILQGANLVGSDAAWIKLKNIYAGNPLALKLVSEPIRELFGGDIESFLEEKEIVFGDIQQLLEQQFRRLSELEQEVMYWLAIERESVSLHSIAQEMVQRIAKRPLVEAIDSLRRRYMIEVRGTPAQFTLQPVIMEYVTGQLIERVYQEIATTETPKLFANLALCKAQAKDYIRHSQARLILAPIAERLLASFGQDASEKKCRDILTILRMQPQQANYAAGNVLNLLIYLQADLHTLDCSRLTVRQAYLQDVALPAVNFSHTNLATSVFSDTFSNILTITVSADGSMLALGTTSGEVLVWDAHTATPLFTCPGHTDGIRSVAFSPDGALLASGSEDQTIRLWDTSRHSIHRCLKILEGHTAVIHSVAFNPDATLLASASEDHTVRLWNLATGQCSQILREHTHWVRAVSFSPDGKMLASGSNDQTIRLWNIINNSACCLHILHEHTDYIRTIAFSPDGRLLASGSEDRTIRLWDLTTTPHCVAVLQGHTNRVRAIAFTSDSQLLASSSDDNSIRIWEHVHTPPMPHNSVILQGHTNRIWSVSFIPNSRTLISASEDDTVRYWEARSGRRLKTLHGHTYLIKSIAFSPDDRFIASGSEDQLIRIWELATGRCLKILHGHANRVRCVAFSPDGTELASGSEDETIRIWTVSTGHCRKILSGHTHLVRSIAYTSDGSTIISGSYDQTVRLWDISSGQCLKVLSDPHGIVLAVAASSDGTLLASGGEDHTIHVWDSRSGDRKMALKGHTNRLWSISFKPNSSVITSSSDDHTIRIWNTNTGECTHTLRGHTSWVRSVAWSPDGSLIASGSHDRTVRLWDAHSSACLATLRGHHNSIWSVAFNPSSTQVASAGDDGTIRNWDLSTGQCIQILQSERLYEQMNITGAKGLTEAQRTALKELGAIET
jgi:WD40 repeat protein/transcriptional regulator with XRE-family HTH domain